MVVVFFFFQAEDGIRDLVRSRGLGDVYKRQRPRGGGIGVILGTAVGLVVASLAGITIGVEQGTVLGLSLIHI